MTTAPVDIRDPTECKPHQPSESQVTLGQFRDIVPGTRRHAFPRALPPLAGTTQIGLRGDLVLDRREKSPRKSAPAPQVSGKPEPQSVGAGRHLRDTL